MSELGNRFHTPPYWDLQDIFNTPIQIRRVGSFGLGRLGGRTDNKHVDLADGLFGCAHHRKIKDNKKTKFI
jgi:hypothetical protein